MSLLAGDNVTVADNETTATGSGLKLELYNAEKAVTTLPPLYTLGQTTSPFSPEAPATQEDLDTYNPMIQGLRLTILRSMASRANAYGAAVVGHVATNGKAVVGITTSCGRTPDPNNPNTAILGPSSELELTIR